MIAKIDKKKRYLENKYKAAKEFKKNFFSIQKNDVDLYKSINVKRGNWTHDEYFWNKHGKEGRNLAKLNLS